MSSTQPHVVESPATDLRFPRLLCRGAGADAATDAGDDVLLYIRPGRHVRLPAAAQLSPSLVTDTHQTRVRLVHDCGRGGAHQPADCYDVRHLPADTG